ncbi:hypothetical protein GCM10010300_24640 [Streptomyces olivaceoviridis]|nr:hypothetical protein GCM10010300_24640 [Streptomyces olivaceoviridis]
MSSDDDVLLAEQRACYRAAAAEVPAVARACAPLPDVRFLRPAASDRRLLRPHTVASSGRSGRG